MTYLSLMLIFDFKTWKWVHNKSIKNTSSVIFVDKKERSAYVLCGQHLAFWCRVWEGYLISRDVCTI